MRKSTRVALSAILIFGPISDALAQTITAPSSFTGDPDNWQTLHTADDPFDVNPDGLLGDMRITVTVTAGAVRLGTTTGLTAPTGYTTGQWTSGSATDIAFEGNETNLDNALASLQFLGSSATMTSTAAPAGAAYYAATGNFYRYIVSNDVDWTDAETQAGNTANQLNGITGYLASITSQGEMDFVVEKIGGTNPAWVGGSDATSEGTWRWRNGDVFWNGAGSANGGAPATADTFHDWCTDQEPNNSGNEDYLQIRFTGGDNSCWNDLSNDGSDSASNDPDGFVAEYDGSSSAVATTFSNVVPTAVSVTRNSPSGQIILNTTFESCGLTPSFTVTFSENVSNVDAADFQASGAGATGVTVSGVTGSGTSYTVTLNCPGDNNRGAINLALASGNNIQDSDNAGLASNSFSTSEGFILSERPVLTSISRSSPSGRAISANDLSGCYQPQLTATFSKSVQNVDTADFTVTGAGSTSVTIDSVTGSGATRTITLGCVPSANRGALQVGFAAGPSIADTDGTTLTSTAIGSNEDYFITDAPVLSSVSRVSPSARLITAVDIQSCVRPQFQATFSEAVSNVDAADFNLTGAAATGMSIDNVSGSGTSYTLTLSCIPSSNRGVIALAVDSGNNITDSLSVGLSGTDIGSNEDYLISARPVLTSITRANPTGRAISAGDLSGCYQPQLTATFSKSVQNVDSADFTISGAGSTGVTVDSVSGSGTTRTLTLGCLPNANRGAFELALAASPSISDTDGTALTTTSIATNEDYFITDAPLLNAVTRIAPTDRLIAVDDIQSCVQPQLRAVFSEAVSNVDAADFTLTGAAAIGMSIDSVVGSGTSYTLTLSCIPSNNRGVIELAIAGGNDIVDGSNVGLSGTDIATNEGYQISDAPLVSAIRRHSPSQEEIRAQDIGQCTQLQFRITFSEAVSNVDTADFAVEGTGGTDLTADAVTPVSSEVYTVALSCLPTGNRGQISLALAASVSIVDSLNIALAVTDISQSEHYTITETRTLPSEDKAVAEVVVASAEAPVVAMEKQVEHIQQRLSEQRATQPASASPDGPLITPQRPPLTPSRKVEIVAQRIQQVTQYFDRAENGNIFFATNSNTLSTPARITLGRQLQQMNRYKSAVYQIEGHTDKRGSLAFNQKLGQSRAKAVRAFFVDNGIDAERVQIVSFGEERPVSACNQENCWSKNRRAQTRLIVSEALQVEIGNEVEKEYAQPQQPAGQASTSWCGLMASITVANDSGSMQGQTPVLCDAAEALSDSLGARWGVWTQGLLSIGIVQSDENSVEMDFTGQNLTFGFDYRFPSQTVLGFALGAGENNMDGQDKSESITRQIVASFYLAQPFRDVWAVNISGGLINSEIENRRPDEQSGAIMAGERDGRSTFANIELVRNTTNPLGSLDLTAGFTTMRTELDGYNETGAQPLAFRAQTIDNESISLGGVLSFNNNKKRDTAFYYKLTASLQYDLSDASTARVNFVNVPAETDYLVLNQNDEPLTASIGGGLDWSNAKGDSLTLDYNYQQNATLSKIHSLAATYRKSF